MKIWKLILFAGLFTISLTSKSQDKSSAQDELQLIVESLLKDTNNLYYQGLSYKIKELAESIKEHGFKKEFLFPYKEYHRIVGYRINKQFVIDNDVVLLGESCIDTSTMELKNFMDKHGVLTNIQSSQIDKVLEIVNNPLNFEWFIHDSQHLKGGIIFLNNKNRIIAYINIYDNGHQLGFIPDNIRFKNGMLKSEYGIKMQIILREIGIID